MASRFTIMHLLTYDSGSSTIYTAFQFCNNDLVRRLFSLCFLDITDSHVHDQVLATIYAF